MKKNGLFWLYVIVFLTATGYGISFPLLSISLEQMGVSGQLIGLNAAMPALGWLLGSLFLPRLQARFGLRAVLLGFLGLAALAIAAFPLTQNFWGWTALRFFYGGGLGLFYRAIEFWINGVSADQVRGRNIGIYSSCFILGIAVGATLQPEFGTQGFTPYWMIIGLFGVAAIFLVFAGSLIGFEQLPEIKKRESIERRLVIAAILALPVVFLAILAYGLFEDIGAYLLSVYALRNHLGEDVAAYTLTAVALGSLFMQVPIGLLSDRMNRQTLLLFCAVLAAALSAAVPFTLENSTVFLLTLAAIGSCSGGIYSTALAMIGDRYEGSDLAIANASFGLVYAFGGLVGPLINGAAIDKLGGHGLMVSAASIFGSFVFVSLLLTRFKKERGGGSMQRAEP